MKVFHAPRNRPCYLVLTGIFQERRVSCSTSTATFFSKELHQAEIYPVGNISEDITRLKPLLKAKCAAQIDNLFLFAGGEQALSFLYILQLATLSVFAVIKGCTDLSTEDRLSNLITRRHIPQESTLPPLHTPSSGY
jgi:hypothetical protein